MATRTDRPEAVLRLKVAGPGVGRGRISVPDLIKICQDVQAAVTRQAEALEGQTSLRPGPYTTKATLENPLYAHPLAFGRNCLSHRRLGVDSSFGKFLQEATEFAL